MRIDETLKEVRELTQAALRDYQGGKELDTKRIQDVALVEALRHLTTLVEWLVARKDLKEWVETRPSVLLKEIKKTRETKREPEDSGGAG
jgi:hypothetical protein